MIFRFGSFELDQDLFELRRDGKPVPIEPKVFGLLVLLVEERHRAVDKKELLTRNWPDAVVGEASLTRAVMEARKALGDDAHEVIVTVRGRGFRFTPTVERVDAGATAPAAQTSLVGRTAAQTSLLARLIAASDGRGGAVWITGEAGIGKTALVDELSRIARGRGTRVLRVQCHDELRVPKRDPTKQVPGTSMPPSSAPASPRYWPWSQLAHACLEFVADTELVGLRKFAQEAATSSAKDDFARFDAFVRDLRVLSAKAPLLVVMEDVQWADEASVTMLQFVSRELADSRTLLVATYRDTPPIAGARGEALARAVHASGGESISLRPLSKEDIAELVERTSHGSASPEAVASLLAKSGGNPLYLRELMAAKVPTPRERSQSNATSLSTDLTDGLRKSIEKHLEALGKPCRELLAVASLMGPSFDLPTITTVSGASSDVVLDRLAEAVVARMIEKSPTGTYTFRHALVRSVLSRSLSGTDRAKAHAAIARVLDAHWGRAANVHAEQLAHHYVRALPYGDPLRALETSSLAAELSKTRGDPMRAAVHYERALESLRHMRGEEARGVGLHLSLAHVRETFDPERAREAYLDAAVLASALHQIDPLCEAALAFARTDAPKDSKVALLERARAQVTSGPRRKELDGALAKLRV